MTDVNTDPDADRRRRRLLRARRPDQRHQGARRSDRAALGDPRVRGPDRQPGQPAPALDHRGRHRAGRRVRGGDPGRGRLRREVVLLPGLPAPRALDRRPGRDQRGQELQGRRRLRLPALLRHDQGRRLPLARVERLPAGRGQPQHHRPVRGAGRPVRPRVRRPPRQPVLRRRTGVPHLLRPRPDRPAAPARGVPGARAAGRRRHREDLHPPRDARAGRGRRAGPRDHRARPGHRGDRDLLRRRRRARLRRLRQRLLPVHQRDGVQRHGLVAGAPQGRADGQPLLHADPPDLHPGGRGAPVEAHADERVAAQRRPDLGAQGRDARRHRPAGDRRGRPRLLPRADLPGVRQPGPSRHRLPAGQEHVRRGPWRRPGGRRRTTRGVPRLHRRHRAAGARARSRRSTATSSTCTPRSRARTPTRCRCGSTPPCTT